MERLRHATVQQRPEIIISTANIAFLITRFMLFFGHFNYGRRGILDRTHTRLFTFESLNELLEQAGYKIMEVRGVPAPYPRALGGNSLSRALIAINQVLIKLSPGLFSYQIFIRAKAQPTVEHLLSETIHTSEEMKKEGNPELAVS